MNPRFETIAPDAGTSFNFVHFTCDDFASDHTWHYHPEYELTWIVRSSGTRFVGNSIQPYEAGDLVLIGPGLPHCWHNDGYLDGAERPELFLVQFEASFLGKGFFALPEARAVRHMLEESGCGLHFRGSILPAITPLMLRMKLACGLERIALLLQVLAVLASAPCSKLASADYQTANDISPANRMRIEAVHRYVRDNLHNDLCQADIAETLNMSPSAFSKFFKSATGHTFVGFINVIRINEACRLLSTTELNITQIAMQTGYNNISHFNRQFFQLKATTPRDFRRCQGMLGQTQGLAESSRIPA